MILCVDPVADSRAATRTSLADGGLDTVAAESLTEALDMLDHLDRVECVVTEYELEGGTGLELVERVRETHPDALCVVFTTTPVDSLDTETVGDVVAEYLDKGAPEARDELLELVEQGLAFQSQTAYPLPEDGGARVAALDRFSPAPGALAESFDRLTALTTALFDVSSTAIGFVGAHREEFLACDGRSFDGIPREDTICTYAILDDAVTVVENVQADPRFSENDDLQTGSIRFYAGAPILTPDGHAIGTVCVHDDHPREFDEADRERLSMLADQVMHELVLHRRLRENAGGPVDG